MSEDKLKLIRHQIDSIDKQFYDLLKQRAELAAEVAKIKKQQDNPVYYRPEREAQILRAIVASNDSLLPDHDVARVFRDIMSACLALQKPLTIAYLGPKGTFTQLAVEKHFGESVNTSPQNTITDIFRQVETGEVHYGVVPVENSTEGIVNLTLDNLINSNVHICGEIILPIHYHLACKNPDFPLQTIYAHQQALAQCRHWLAMHYPSVDLCAVESNGKAAQLAAEQNDAAAICSDKAVDLYGLNKIHQHIEDYPNNSTRFLIIGRQVPAPSGADKTSLIISTPHNPGSLIQLLQPFEKYQINMTMIASRPYRHRNWSYLFFIDFEGHQAEQPVKDVLNDLASMSVMMTLLGSYPQALS